MLVNILVVSFICMFFGLVAFGHVLLITAIWPGLLRYRRQTGLGIAADASAPLQHLK